VLPIGITLVIGIVFGGGVVAGLPAAPAAGVVTDGFGFTGGGVAGLPAAPPDAAGVVLVGVLVVGAVGVVGPVTLVPVPLPVPSVFVLLAQPTPTPLTSAAQPSQTLNRFITLSISTTRPESSLRSTHSFMYAIRTARRKVTQSLLRDLHTGARLKKSAICGASAPSRYLIVSLNMVINSAQ
jgi:hypothetical protein